MAGRRDRLALYRLLRHNPEIRLTFVTGRGVETVPPFLSDPLIPDPEFIVADVGATVVHGDAQRPVQPAQWEIDQRWIGVEPVMPRLSSADWAHYLEINRVFAERAAAEADESRGALLSNPYDIEALSDGLYRALNLPEEERHQRLVRLSRVVERYDVAAWSRDFLRALSTSSERRTAR